jgi:hypothetical protein
MVRCRYRPSAGTVHHIKCSVKARYKAAVKDAYVAYEEAHSDALLEHFLNKKIPEFWKCWNAKFRRNVEKQVVINGHSNDIDIANEFANHFGSVYATSPIEAAAKDFCSDFIPLKSMHFVNLIVTCLS